jgi:hypothetical protein
MLPLGTLLPLPLPLFTGLAMVMAANSAMVVMMKRMLTVVDVGLGSVFVLVMTVISRDLIMME